MRDPQSSPLPFLGRGWAFPPLVLPATQQVAMVAGVADIAESLHILLSTSQGERVMLPTYGCNLSRFVFADIDTGTLSEIQDMVQTAIVRWEPRIDVLGVTVALDPGRPGTIAITVEYDVRRTNVRSNIVFPYYFTEATLAPDA